MFASGAAEILRACREGRLPAPVALMRLILTAREPEEIDRALAGQSGEIAELWRARRDFWPLAKSVQASVAGEDIAADFDRAADHSADAASALYSLGDPDLLQAATAEVIDHLAASGAPLDQARILDIGCGSGRFEAALALRASEILALEVSQKMAAAARRRCAPWPNIAIALCEASLPPDLGEDRFDLALAVDCFPYIQPQDGRSALWFAAVARALRPGGRFVILNYSYRGNLAQDIDEVARLGASNGLKPLVLGASPFRLWDGAAFHLRRERRSGRSG